MIWFAAVRLHTVFTTVHLCLIVFYVEAFLMGLQVCVCVCDDRRNDGKAFVVMKWAGCAAAVNDSDSAVFEVLSCVIQNMRSSVCVFGWSWCVLWRNFTVTCFGAECAAINCEVWCVYPSCAVFVCSRSFQPIKRNRVLKQHQCLCLFDPLKVTEVKLKDTFALVHGLERICAEFLSSRWFGEECWCPCTAQCQLYTASYCFVVDVVAKSMQYGVCTDKCFL